MDTEGAEAGHGKRYSVKDTFFVAVCGEKPVCGVQSLTGHDPGPKRWQSNRVNPEKWTQKCVDTGLFRVYTGSVRQGIITKGDAL